MGQEVSGVTAGIYNFTCEQGATFSRTFTAYDADGDPINLTGFSGRMQVRRTVDASAVIISLTTANGRMSLGGATGVVTLTLTATETAAITESGVYDLELVSAGGTVTRLLKGSFRLDKEVTR